MTALLIPLAFAQTGWTGWGGNIFNNRWARETSVSSESVHTLKQHCQLGGFAHGISAAPALHNHVVYFPSWNGLMTAYDYEDCEVKWQTNISAYLEQYSAPSAYQAAFTSPVSRTSPQIDGDVLYIGTLRYALLLALDINTGSVLAHTVVNTHPLAIVTMSPTFYRGIVFVGAASGEEQATVDPTYPCCNFVGNFAAITFDRDSKSFRTWWNQSTLPEPIGPGGWSGAAIWGSQPSIDVVRHQVFIGTGNTYEIPSSVQACVNTSDSSNETACYPSSVWQESVIAFDIASGHVNWIQHLSPLEAWIAACGVPGILPTQPTCPPNPGPDADFAMAPSFVSSHVADTPHARDVVVIGQKNGNVYAIDAANGTIYWVAVVGPDVQATGTLLWGIAVDEARAYFTVLDPLYDPWTLQPSGHNISNAGYGAVRLCDGAIVWEVPVPHNSSSFAPPSVANDLVIVGRSGRFVTSLAPNGTRGSVMLLDKASGAVVDEIAADNIIWGGVAVQGEFIMFGTGYSYGGNANGSFNVWAVSKHMR